MTASWIIDQLVQQGVHHFCIAPGSRSTPLVMAAATHKKAKIHVHYDERGLGFYALGLAKGSAKPAALIITSGTALGNVLPSVMEAHHTCTPMILLTADRPAELKDCSANQTTDQVKLFQPFIRWQVDLPCELNEAYFRSIMAQAYFYACQNPPGPVHINCPFRDPLYDPNAIIEEGKPFEIQFPKHKVELKRSCHSKGLILIGRLPNQSDVHSILKLAERLQWPVCADILSNARCFSTPEQIRNFDWIEKPEPELVLHFGERMTSKKILEWLKRIKTELIHISPWPFLQDPARILTGRVQADIVEFCQAFDAPSDPSWLKSWEDSEPVFEEGDIPLSARNDIFDKASAQGLQQRSCAETGHVKNMADAGGCKDGDAGEIKNVISGRERYYFTEVHAMRQISQILPEEFGVFLGNGMPIRDADHFLFPKTCKGFFGNRGLSGIDGNIATLAGLAEEMPILGIIGDQATLYDLNSLPLLKKTKHPVILLISNNFGGGIFHHLPVSESPHFETLWAAAHDIRFEHAAKLFDIPYFQFDAIHKALQSGKSGVVELITNRIANYKYQKSLCLPVQR